MNVFILLILFFLPSCHPQKPPLRSDGLAMREPRLIKQKVVDPKVRTEANATETQDCFLRYDKKIKCVEHDEIVRATKLQDSALKEYVDTILIKPETQPVRQEAK